MNRTFRILNIGAAGHAGQVRRRQWLEPGEPISIGPGTALTLQVDRHGDEYAARVITGNAGVSSEAPLLPGDSLEVYAATGLMMLPRAMEEGIDGRPLRYLMEFVQRWESVRCSL